MIEVMSSLLIVSGLGFYLAGSIGLLRLPDLYSRLHALTKADNLGLGLLTAGLALYTQDLLIALKLVLIWLAVLAASATRSPLGSPSLRGSFSDRRRSVRFGMQSVMMRVEAHIVEPVALESNLEVCHA